MCLDVSTVSRKENTGKQKKSMKQLHFVQRHQLAFSGQWSALSHVINQTEGPLVFIWSLAVNKCFIVPFHLCAFLFCLHFWGILSEWFVFCMSVYKGGMYLLYMIFVYVSVICNVHECSYSIKNLSVNLPLKSHIHTLTKEGEETAHSITIYRYI